MQGDMAALRRYLGLPGAADGTMPPRNQEMRAEIVGEAEQLVDIAFSVADMHATVGSARRESDCRKFSSQRKLAFFSIVTRVGLIFP